MSSYPSSPLRRLPTLVAVCMAAAATSGASQSQSPFALINSAAEQSAITQTALRDGIAMLSGSGGNITVLTGPDGALLVDAGIAVSKDKIRSALTSLNAHQLRYVVNTHWHWDHTDGNGWMREAGATVLAHTRTVEHLSETIRVEEWDHTFPPAVGEALPQVPIAGHHAVRLNGEIIEIRAYPGGHTDGDLWVRFEKADVVALGDTFWNGQYPFIDYVAGGGVDGLIAQTELNLSQVGEHTIIVPGHGPVARRTDLLAYRNMLVIARDRIAAMKAEGLSLAQVIAAQPTAAYDERWGASVVTPAMFAGLVYRGV